MATSIFSEKETKPDETMVTEILAETGKLWDKVKNHVADFCGDTTEEWKFYSKKAGWMLVVKCGKRTVCYLIPQEGFFKVNFVYGQKAVDAAEATNLPEAIMAQIREARAYVEGRSFMIDVKTEADTDTIKKLIEIKWQS